MLHKVHLHGSFRTYGDNVVVSAKNACEAIYAASRLLKMKVHPVSGRLLARVVGFDTAEAMIESLAPDQELHLVPAFLGGKSALVAAGKIIIGAVLIVLSFFVPGLPQYAATFLFTTGASLVVGGISNLLFPVKQADKPNDGSYTAATGNTTAIGTRIPLALGRNVRMFGQILSYNVSTGAT